MLIPLNSAYLPFLSVLNLVSCDVSYFQSDTKHKHMKQMLGQESV